MFYISVIYIFGTVIDSLIPLEPYIFHINLYDAAFFGALFISLTFAMLLGVTRWPNRSANHFLAMALVVVMLWMARIVAIDIGLSAGFPQFSLAFGPLLFFYVLKTTRPEYKFRRKDLLHFSPLLLELCVFLPEIAGSVKKFNPALQFLAFVSVVIYLYKCRLLVADFYRGLEFKGGDRYRHELKWLHSLLTVFGVIWLLWVPVVAISYLYDGHLPGAQACYPMYLLLASTMIWIVARAFLRPVTGTFTNTLPVFKQSLPDQLKQKGAWLKHEVKLKRYYEDPDLSLGSLAAKLDLHPHELSRIINTVFKKSFNDFINEYRVRDVAGKMQDPAYDRITLLGMAFDAGFNSKATFIRAFKQLTGKNPAEYKRGLEKEVSTYHLQPHSRTRQIILVPEAPIWFHEQLNYNYMFRNYLKTAWRNLLRNKFYSIINIAGLTVGLAVGILILLWVQDELSFDNFHKQGANICKLEHYGGTGASRQIYSIDVAPIGPLAKAQMPEVKDQVRIRGNYEYSLYKYKDKTFADENVVYADPSFFSIFDFHLVSGNPAKPFTDNNSVVITKSIAEKFFGNENPIGKVIRGDNKTDFAVSGVIDDFPKNSSINYDMIMPMNFYIQSMLANHQDVNSDFGYLDYETYLLLKPGSSVKALGHKLWQVHQQHNPGRSSGEYLLLPISKMHLYNADLSDRGISTVRIFIVIALLILLIACINYINLSTARSMLRSKEISMRKIIGAGKWQLFAQFIVETALLFSLAVMLALGLVYILMPAFNQLAGKQLVLNLADYHIWLILLAAITGTLAASSIYPALLLSSFEPLAALKGKISAGVGNVFFRKVLVVVQFTFSIILIIGTIIIARQLDYIRSKDLGYDKTDVITMWMRDMGPHYEAAKAELLKDPSVLGVTRSAQNIVRNFAFFGEADWDGKDPKQSVVFHPINIDKDFIPFFKIKLIQGVSFTGAISDTAHFILNETAIKQMGIKDPIGKRFRAGETTGTIIGVVQDFHFKSMKETIAPAIFWYGQQPNNRIYIKTARRDAPKAVAALERQFKAYNSDFPASCQFLDDVFNNLYQGEQREGRLFTNFAAIAIFISCLGLLGLAAYTAQVRTREIGVRKVLGASVSRIVTLLIADFIKLVVLALIIATPIAWYAMYKWLQGYAYRANISWWIFVLGGVTAILIAFITISFQSIKAAAANPVKSLRSE